MLDDNFKEYLNDEFGRIFPESQEEYRKLFTSLNFGQHIVMKFMGKLDIWLI